jgi:hypothetical protein
MLGKRSATLSSCVAFASFSGFGIGGGRVDAGLGTTSARTSLAGGGGTGGGGLVGRAGRFTPIMEASRLPGASSAGGIIVHRRARASRRVDVG